MDKYTELMHQVICETRWCKESIMFNHPNMKYIPIDLHLVDFIGNEDYKDLTDYERGMLFAYLSIMSKIRAMEGQ